MGCYLFLDGHRTHSCFDCKNIDTDQTIFPCATCMDSAYGGTAPIRQCNFERKNLSIRN